MRENGEKELMQVDMPLIMLQSSVILLTEKEKQYGTGN